MSKYDSYTYSIDHRFYKRGVEFTEYVFPQKFSVNMRTTFRCLECGHEWESTPRRIQMGELCPKCITTNKVLLDLGEWLLIDVDSFFAPKCVALVDADEYTEYRRFHRKRFEPWVKYVDTRCKQSGDPLNHYVSVMLSLGLFDPFYLLRDHGDLLLDLRKSNISREPVERTDEAYIPIEGFEGILWEVESKSFILDDEEEGILGHYPDFLSAYNAWRSDK